jgi:hypothetical protein
LPVSVKALKQARWKLGLLLLFTAFLIVANEATTQDKCQTRVGRLAVRWKLDSYYSGCKCMKHSLDFSDRCNSMYVL